MAVNLPSKTLVEKVLAIDLSFLQQFNNYLLIFK